MARQVDILLKVASDIEGLRKAQEGFVQLKTATQGVGSMFRMGGVFGAGLLSLQGLTRGLTDAIAAGVRYNQVLERQAATFKVLLGSVEAARERMDVLQRFAGTTPFDLPEVVQASRVLESLTRGALATEDGLRLVGDAAAATGRPFSELAMWVGRLYAGLQSGTPVGEATMRLLEMGVVSGEQKQRLDALAESGDATGNAMMVVRDALSRTSGAMREAALTGEGLSSTFRDMVSADLAVATEGITDSLNAIKRAILEARGLIATPLQAREQGRTEEAASLASAVDAAVNPAQLDYAISQVERARERYAQAMAQWGETVAQAARNGTAATLVRPPEIDSIAAQLARLDALLDRARSADQARKIEEAREAVLNATGIFGPGNVEGEAAFRRARAMQEGADEEDSYWRQQAIADYQEQNRLLDAQLRNDEQRRAHAEAMAEAHRQMILMQSYTGGTQGRWESWQQSASIDREAGLGAGAVAGVQNAIMAMGTQAEQVGRAIETSIGGALEGISSSIAGLIRGTMTWAEAFANVGRAILDAVINAFAQMVAQMIVSFALQKVFGGMAQKQAAQVGAAWHGAAVSASIATYGTAAGVGLAAFMAAQAAGVGAATGMQAGGGFALGGYTGDGPRYEIAGPVHRGEFVFSAPQVDRLGLTTLEHLASGEGSAVPAMGGGDQAPMRVVIVDNRRDADELRRDPRFRSMIVDLMEA